MLNKEMEMKIKNIFKKWWIYPIFVFILLIVLNRLPLGQISEISILLVLFFVLISPSYYAGGLGWWLGKKKNKTLGWILTSIFVIITFFITLSILGEGFRDFGNIGLSIAPLSITVGSDTLLLSNYGNAECRTTNEEFTTVTNKVTGYKTNIPLPLGSDLITVHIKTFGSAEGWASTTDNNRLFYKICTIKGCKEYSFSLYELRTLGKCDASKNCNMEIKLVNEPGLKLDAEYWDMKITSPNEKDEEINNGFEFYIVYNPICLVGETAHNQLISNCEKHIWGCDITKLGLGGEEFYGEIISNTDVSHPKGTCTSSSCYKYGTYNWVGYYSEETIFTENLAGDQYCMPLLNNGQLWKIGYIEFKVADQVIRSKTLESPIKYVTCCPSMSTDTKICVKDGNNFRWEVGNKQCLTTADCPGGGTTKVFSSGNPLEMCLYTCSSNNCNKKECETVQCTANNDCKIKLNDDKAICSNGECTILDPCKDNPALCRQCVTADDCKSLGEGYHCIDGTCSKEDECGNCVSWLYNKVDDGFCSPKKADKLLFIPVPFTSQDSICPYSLTIWPLIFIILGLLIFYKRDSIKKFFRGG